MIFQGGLFPLKDRIFSFPLASSRLKGSVSSAYGSSSIPLALLPDVDTMPRLDEGRQVAEIAVLSVYHTAIPM